MCCVYIIIFVAEKHQDIYKIICMTIFLQNIWKTFKWYCNCLSAFLQQIYMNKTWFSHAILCLCDTIIIIPTRLVFKFKEL